MDVTVIAAVSLGLVATYVFRQVLSFFYRLDKDSCDSQNLQLEDPNSVKPLMCPSIWSEPTKKLSIVIPAYNEEDRLPATLDETLSYLQRRSNKQGPAFTYEVIIVDDGSKDKTAAVATNYVKQHGVDAVRLLRLPVNSGKGRAVRDGMLIARGELCLFMDADGATRVQDMEQLEAAIKDVSMASWGCRKVITATPTAQVADSSGPLGIAVGSRAHLEKAAVAKRTWLRNFLMHGFHVLVTFVAGHAVHDTQCGFKMFTRRAAAVLYTNQRLQRWCFDVELIFLAEQLGVPIKEVQVGCVL
eukprot:GHRR01017976.1.p1 GENE.GHRR01017976.1~~GHRR01017976.1.p1  ORF type:complete len:301 (+),score=93.61 GHRR01017976.1:235-1137(+)